MSPALEGITAFFPCHNEEANVEPLIQDALRFLPQVATRYEIILIDDGSTDRTAEIASRYPNPVRLVKHERCQGYGAALISGFRAAQYPWIFYSDGDRQFDLAELPRLVEWADRADIISGIRTQRADPAHRVLNARLYGLALRLAFGLDIPDVNCAFKLYRREVLDKIDLKTTGALINAEIFAKAIRRGFRVKTIPVSHRARTAGSQSGARPRVILKAMAEFVALAWDLWTNHEPR